MDKLLSVEDLNPDLVEEIFKTASTFKGKGIPKKYNGDWILMFLEEDEVIL